MTAISGFSTVDVAGFPVFSDPHGNNVAFRCLGCGAPVLAVVLDNQRGSSQKNPAVCRACGSRYWVEAIVAQSRLVVQRVPSHVYRPTQRSRG